ncbi:Transposase IS200 like protein [Rubripirellula lacrimiformis]|uniref:Transposase IS200 like protein n=1 Tax=Rubripirellula lacrimiformis TaxID=1930273 RepID=A0A517NJB4_9BACT|nr:transposase [Rubripirellula lacrimiformis]QDT07232.1 Transposase IS200 like protein [Rubripirellula lacrimiformis]
MSDYKIKTDVGDAPMGDVVAFFITWPTYGTWLPGDTRGWVEYRHGWQLPQPSLELECRSQMTEDACKLTLPMRLLCNKQVRETCQFRGWQVHAANCRSNHMHIVIGANEATPKKIRRDIKAWCTRRLKEDFDSKRENWWAERGSIRWVWNEESLATVVGYATEAQDQSQPEA